jgi:hypothetical protein
MPAPATYEYSADAIEAANTALLALIDAGSSNAEIKLYDDSDQLLATIPLNDPAGTVNASTGVLTITASGPDTAADERRHLHLRHHRGQRRQRHCQHPR